MQTEGKNGKGPGMRLELAGSPFFWYYW